jgi:phage shock protein A
MARAQIQVHEAVRDVSALDPTSELRRFEDRVRHEEALARGMDEVASQSIDEQFAELSADEDEREVEARLARLKAGQGQRTLSGR